jgi:hypothetical protein
MVADRGGDSEVLRLGDVGRSLSHYLHPLAPRTDPNGGYTDMRTMLKGHPAILWFFALATTPGLPALAGIEATATRNLTVQPAGSRPGEVGSRYFTVEGVKKDRYASFGVLVFELPKGGDQAGDVDKLSLRLVQSVSRFTQDGKVRFVVAEPADRGTNPLAGLKFEVGSSGGVGKDAFKALHPLGSGTFK